MNTLRLVVDIMVLIPFLLIVWAVLTDMKKQREEKTVGISLVIAGYCVTVITIIIICMIYGS